MKREARKGLTKGQKLIKSPKELELEKLVKRAYSNEIGFETLNLNLEGKIESE